MAKIKSNHNYQVVQGLNKKYFVVDYITGKRVTKKRFFKFMSNRDLKNLIKEKVNER